MKSLVNSGCKNNIDSKALAKQILSEIQNRTHPYTVYSRDDIPSLKEKVKSGVSKKAFAQLISTADSYLSKSGKLCAGLHPAVGRFFQSRFAYLILAGEITGNEIYLNKATELARDAIHSGDIDMYVKFNNALSVGDFAHAYALAYDLLYDRLSEDDRAAFRKTMEELGDWIYNNSPAINTWGSQEPRRMAWNWNVVTHGALGLMALSLGDHEEWLELSIERMLGYCQYAVDSTGAAMEGLHYIGFALNTLTPLDLAIYRLTGVELMDGFPAMQRLPYWSMDMTVPFGGEQAAIGQGGHIGNHSATFYIINRYHQADALWGWLRTYGVDGDGEFSVEYEGNGWSLPALILFEDQSLLPVMPDNDNAPLIQNYAKGIITARDTREKNGSMATFNCGYGYAGCWNHPDDTTFTFYAKGESFVIDLGANRKTSAEHNIPLMDGIGTDFIAGATMVIGKIEQNSVLENGELYLRGNNTSSYVKLAQLDKSIRHMIYRGGDTPFVIACDFIQKSGEHTYTTNFYTKAANTVELSEGESVAVISGDNGGAKCCVTAYSPNGIVMTKTPTDNGITTASSAKFHRQAVVFVAAEPEKLPKIDFTSDEDSMTVSIALNENGEEKKMTYAFSIDALAAPSAVSSRESLPIPQSVLDSIGQEAATVIK